jgi:hypothetical protein
MYRRGVTFRLPGALRPARVAGALAAGVLAFGLALAIPAAPARANGTPIRIVLSYLQGVSNFGPQNATGVSELITSEGEVRLTAAGLQKLGDAEEYQLWISSGEAKQQLRLGTVQVNDAGVGRLDTVLKQPIPDQPWDLMTITVEAQGAQGAAPSDKRSIAGRFSMAEPNGPAPRVLPNTGGGPDPDASPPSSSGLLGLSGGGTILLALLVVGGLGFALGRVGSSSGKEPVR